MEYKGYTIKMIMLDDTLFFPQIWLKGTWIHEFMGGWEDEDKAIQASKDFIDQCDGTPTTDDHLFAAAEMIRKRAREKNEKYGRK